MVNISFTEIVLAGIVSQLIWVMKEIVRLKTIINGLKGRCSLMGGAPDETKD